MNRPLTALCITRRARMLLVGAGIQSVEALCERRAIDLLKIRGFGEASLKDVREELAARGLALAGEERSTTTPVQHDMTISEIVLAKVLAAVSGGVSTEGSDASRSLYTVVRALWHEGWWDRGVPSEKATKLLDRARKAGVL